MISSSDYAFLDCPLQCGHTASGYGCKFEMIFHLKEECSKRFLIDSDSNFCEDPDSSVILIHDNKEHVENCSKCAEKNDFKSIIDREIPQTEEHLSDNNGDKTLIINSTNLDIDESIIDYKKVFNKDREEEELIMEEDSYDRKTNFTSRPTSVNDTMIACEYEAKPSRSKFKDSFYDISRFKRLKSVFTSKSLNDTMCEGEVDGSKLGYSYNNFKFSKGKNKMASSDDTMIMDTTKNIPYNHNYIQNEIREEDNEEMYEGFYMEGEFLDFEDIKEYFIN